VTLRESPAIEQPRITRRADRQQPSIPGHLAHSLGESATRPQHLKIEQVSAPLAAETEPQLLIGPKPE
jgi:hypothetical protein